MPNLPLVSILIPAYHEKYFRLAFQSALAQTYPNIEIVISDDSPGDSTRRYVEEGQWPVPVRYQFNPDRHDRGHSNFNRCFRMAQGEYIKFLCDDDLLAPNCVERMMTALLDHPEATLATSRRQRIDADGLPLDDSEATLPPITEDALVDGPSLCRAVLTAMVNCIGEPTVPLFHRSALDCSCGDILTYAGHWPGSLSDVAMWFTALRQGHCIYLAEPLSSFRVHGSQDQQADETRGRSLADYKVLCRLARDSGLIDAATADNLNRRPRWIPGWATLLFKPLQQSSGDWLEAMLYFGPERIPLGATTARLDDLKHVGDKLGVSDSFLFQEQFAQIEPSPSTVPHCNRTTRKCMLLWNQLLVNRDGMARPCPRRAPTRDIYVTSLERELQLARFQLLIGHPGGECRDCDLCPHVPLQKFVAHNFRGRHNLLQASRDRLVIAELDGVKENPARILVVGHSAGRAGGEFVALSLVRSLVEDFGCQVTLVLARGGALANEFRRYARVFVIGEDLLGTEATQELFLRLRLVEGFRYAICNTVVTGRYATWLKSFGYQVTHLVHELSTNIEFLPDEDRHGVCDSPDTLVFPVGFVKSSLLDRYTPRSRNLVLHPQGIEPDFERPADRQTIRNRIRAKHALPADARLVIGAGSGELRKGPDLFLQVAHNVLAKTSDLKTHFVWLGELEASLSAWIRHDARTLGLEQNLHLAGVQSDLTDYYLGADIFLMTSREDPLPNVVIESMYAGLPVIAFAEGGGTPELLEDGCGIVVPYLDTEAMATATRHLLDDPEATRNIGKLAAQRIETGFHRADYVDFLLSHFTAPVHRVTLVLPAQDAVQLGQQLERLGASFDTIDWRPDALVLISPEAGPISLPPALATISITHLSMPRETPPVELLAHAASQANTELLWFVDLVLEQITGDLPTLITAFDSPQVVAAFGPGHNPAKPDALAPIPLALLGLNERHWLKARWLYEESTVPLVRSTPVLALASGLLRRAAVKTLLTNQNFKSKTTNPLWFWPLLVDLGKLGALAWTPRPTVIPLENAQPGTGGKAQAWWDHWCQAQDAAARRMPAVDRTEQEQDRRQLRDALGLSITATTGKQKPGAQPSSSLSSQPVALSPKEELSRYHQAADQIERGRLEKAQALLVELAQRGCTLWQVYFDLGRIAFEQEQRSQAIIYFRQAASLEFSSTNALRNLVAIYTMNQEYGAALAAAGLILRREEDSDLVALLRAIVTEAGVNLDSLNWASPQLEQQRQAEQQTLATLEQRLNQAERTITTLERQLLLAQAGLQTQSMH